MANSKILEHPDVNTPAINGIPLAGNLCVASALDVSGQTGHMSMRPGPSERQETPTTRVLHDEVRADMFMIGSPPGAEQALATKLKQDIHDIDNLQSLSLTFKADLPNEPKVMKHFADPHFKIMLTP